MQLPVSNNVFINFVCAHAVSERSTDREWHNLSGTSSDDQREREREWEKICKGRRTDTKRHPKPDQTLWTQTSDNGPTDSCELTTFSKFANLYIFKFRISIGWSHLAKLLCHLSLVPNSLFSFPQWNLSQTWIHVAYILDFLSWMLCTHLNFPILLTFPPKDFSLLNS